MPTNSLRSFIIAQVTRGGRSVVPRRNFSSPPSSIEFKEVSICVSTFIFQALKGLAIGWGIRRLFSDYEDRLQNKMLLELQRELELKLESEGQKEVNPSYKNIKEAATAKHGMAKADPESERFKFLEDRLLLLQKEMTLLKSRRALEKDNV